MKVPTVEILATSKVLLTLDQIDGLVRIRDRGSLAWAAGRGRAGGAVSRMFDRLVEAGYASGPPYQITDKGRAALKEIGR